MSPMIRAKLSDEHVSKTTTARDTLTTLLNQHADLSDLVIRMMLASAVLGLLEVVRDLAEEQEPAQSLHVVRSWLRTLVHPTGHLTAQDIFALRRPKAGGR